MDKLLFSAIIGLVAGVIDIIPMVMQKLPRYSIVSAFFHYFFVSIIILNVDIPHIPWWLEGGVVGLALTIPMLIQVGHSDKKSLVALLGVILAYQVIGTAFEWAICGNFFLAVQDFRIGIPGMLIQWFGGYALLKAISKL